MVLARAWRRRLYASVGSAVLVPAALLGALAVLALNGGVSSLSALNQALTGPSAPTAATPVLGAGTGPGPSPASALAAARGPASSASGAASRSGGGASLVAARPGPGSGVSSAPADRPAGSPGGGIGNSGGHQQSGGDQNGGQSLGGNPPPSHGKPPPSQGSPQPPPHHSQPTVVDRAVRTVTPVTSALPAPAGPTLTQVVNTAGSVGDQVLSKLPHK